jgi:hypothetical protein
LEEFLKALLGSTRLFSLRSGWPRSPRPCSRAGLFPLMQTGIKKPGADIFRPGDVSEAQ